MNLFTSNSSCVIGAPLLALVLPVVAAPARAQENLAAPPGWSKSVSNGDVAFSQPSSGNRTVIKKLSPLNGSLRSWFTAQIERDSRSRGQVTSPGVIQAQGPALSQVRQFRSPRGSQAVVYVGYAVGDRGRLMVASGPSPQSVGRAVSELNDVGQQLGAIDARAARNARGTASTSRRPTTQRDSNRTAGGTGSRETRGGIAAGAGKGLKSGQILGVYLDESYGTGVGGMMIMTFEPILLLRDGSARRYLEIPPADLDVARDKAANGRDWGRWSRGGPGFVVRWNKGDKDELKSSFKTKAAKPGQTMARAYETIGGGGNTALGGNVMVAFSNTYQFARNGTFSTDGGGGSSVSATDTSAGVAVSSRRSSAGRYRLDGHTITLRYNDGRVVRKMFYFYPDSDRAIGIGDDTYTIDD